VYGTVEIHSRISVLSSSVSARAGNYRSAKRDSDRDMSLTLGSATEVLLANCKILLNLSPPNFRHLPSSDEGDRTMKHSSSELSMHSIMVVPLVLCSLTSVHVGLVEASVRSLLVMRLMVG